MKRTDFTLKPSLIAMLAAATLLTACGDDNDDDTAVVVTPPAPVMQTFTVTVTNLTANQPMSPVILASHASDAMLWNAGEMASEALEKMAEGGDTADIAALSVINSSVNGTGLLMPGMSETLTLTLDEADVASISLATMLVNTNDAFTGINSYTIAGMEVDATTAMKFMAYDAGTEANSEAKGTMPGPADGGEGFNASRDDVDFVHIHPGVISMYDGLADSVLGASHRFDNPVLAVTIMRTE
ncbi:spondin domain-containing protein [Shewanella sp. SG44-2]|uniref:spondin domain-containing protein n=1 Tax=Shewanella sp. SG44-2 TaxID=2760962 RepID=UPI0016046303|nr:spondin domain-containing protein [Shewanella sp. SG44-2]MBB1425991.1 spondin domain-containing protein [Shewanella sp. SG44-2]